MILRNLTNSTGHLSFGSLITRVLMDAFGSKDLEIMWKFPGLPLIRDFLAGIPHGVLVLEVCGAPLLRTSE